MKEVSLEIGEVVLDGVEAGTSDAERVAEATGSALSDLIAAGGDRPARSRDVERLRIFMEPEPAAGAGDAAAELLARAIHRAMGTKP